MNLHGRLPGIKGSVLTLKVAVAELSTGYGFCVEVWGFSWVIAAQRCCLVYWRWWPVSACRPIA